MFFRSRHSYLAGFDKPAVVSIRAIREAVEDRGFDVLAAWECETGPRLPFRTPAPCGDGWDWVAHLVRTGPDEQIDVPDRVRWIVDATPERAPAPPPSPLPAPPAAEPLPGVVEVVFTSEAPKKKARGVAIAAVLAVGAAAAAWWLS